MVSFPAAYTPISRLVQCYCIESSSDIKGTFWMGDQMGLKGRVMPHSLVKCWGASPWGTLHYASMRDVQARNMHTCLINRRAAFRSVRHARVFTLKLLRTANKRYNKTGGRTRGQSFSATLALWKYQVLHLKPSSWACIKMWVLQQHKDSFSHQTTAVHNTQRMLINADSMCIANDTISLVQCISHCDQIFYLFIFLHIFSVSSANDVLWWLKLASFLHPHEPPETKMTSGIYSLVSTSCAAVRF